MLFSSSIFLFASLPAARPITLRTARFNQQLTKGSLLVEVGGHGNSLEEALAGARHKTYSCWRPPSSSTPGGSPGLCWS